MAGRRAAEFKPAAEKNHDAQLRQDALVSARLPLDKEGQCPENEFNRILWRAMKGSQASYPTSAVKSPTTTTEARLRPRAAATNVSLVAPVAQLDRASAF